MEPQPDEPSQLPPIAAAPISVVLPAHNAESSLDQVVNDWLAYLDGLQREYEILLIDDGSTDGTGKRAEALAASRPRVRVLGHPTRQGVGAAVRTALAAATHPLLCTVSCDPQYQAADLRLMLDVIDHVDLVSGYRPWEPSPGSLRRLGLAYRWLIHTVFGVYAPPKGLPAAVARRLLARVLFGVRLSDVTCPFRLCRRSIFARIPIQSDGPFVHIEILAKANFLGCIMTEVPIGSRSPRPDERPPAQASLREMWADARRVLAHPDFGPVQVAEPAPPALPAQGQP
jgi:glycosyltransferase involved in cell wall biosynthesis